jgi:hypothetical protein
MRKGCLLALGIFFAFLVATVVVVYFHFKNQFDSVYHGKRIYAWADQAIYDNEPTAREEAVQVLMEALDEMDDEPRAQLLLGILSATRDNNRNSELPKELLPFLIRAMKIENRRVYAARALTHVAGPDVVPAVIEVLRTDDSADVRELAAYVLGTLSYERNLGLANEQVEAALREASQDADTKVAKMAAEYLRLVEARRKVH